MPTFWKQNLVWNKPAKTNRVNPEDKVWTAFSKFIRLRDCLRTVGIPEAGKCVTCNKLITYKGNDCGHYIGRSILPTKYDLRNNHLQCMGCNRFGEGMKPQYKMFIVSEYGPEELERIEKLSRNVQKQFTDYDEKAKMWRELEKRLLKAYELDLLGKGQIEIRKTVAKISKENTLVSYLLTNKSLG